MSAGSWAWRFPSTRRKWCSRRATWNGFALTVLVIIAVVVFLVIGKAVSASAADRQVVKLEEGEATLDFELTPNAK